MALASVVAFVYRLIVGARFVRVVRCHTTGPALLYRTKRIIPASMDGITIGRHIFVREAYVNDACMLAHELTHVKQGVREGLMFAIKYFLYWLRYGYRNNPYEREAYVVGKDCFYSRRVCP